MLELFLAIWFAHYPVQEVRNVVLGQSAGAVCERGEADVPWGPDILVKLKLNITGPEPRLFEYEIGECKASNFKFKKTEPKKK